MIKKLVTIMVIFAIGLASGIYAADAYAKHNAWRDGVSGDSILLTDRIQTEATAPFTGVTARESPADRIAERAIQVYKDRVIIDVKDAQWSTFTDTHSMEPVLSVGSNAIQLVPQSADEIKVGDIVSYRSDYAEGIIIHRVVYKGEDEDGTYFIMKGDNLQTSDPGRIRFNQIRRVVVGVIY